jgi:3-dehydroquinate synthase
MLKSLTIQFEKTYPIYIGANVYKTHWLKYCKTLKQRLVLITDSNLMNTLGQELKAQLEASNLNVELLCIKAGEKNKTREAKQQLEDALLDKKLGRDTFLIALGGGVVTDLVGFVAATYCRGISVMYLPTTLLAMVDASIGGKTGVDTPFGKNLIGLFYQPEAVFMDLNVLSTLPNNEWSNGVVEILKHGLIRDKELFQHLQKNTLTLHDPEHLVEIIYQSCLIKKEIIEQDERDLGLRQLLNFGHTIGHAIERLEQFKISHGEAVAIGILVEAHLATLVGVLDLAIVKEIELTLQQYELPLKTAAFNDKVAFKQALELDKKAANSQVYFVLLSGIGTTHSKQNKHVFSVDDSCLDQSLRWAYKKFAVTYMDSSYL